MANFRYWLYMDTCLPYFVMFSILTVPYVYMYKCLIDTKKKKSLQRELDFHSYPARHGDLLRLNQHKTV